MAKRSTTIGIIGGIVAAIVLLGIVGVVALPRVLGARGFCDESTGTRLRVVEAFSETDDLAERAEAEVALAEETAGDLQDKADSVRWPSGAGDDADEVAEAWQQVAEADPADQEAVQAAAQTYIDLDDTYQDEYCGGTPTAEDLGG